MKTITWKEAVAMMDGMAFILANLSAKLEIEVESIEELTRSAFEAYCDSEGIEAIEVE